MEKLENADKNEKLNGEFDFVEVNEFIDGLVNDGLNWGEVGERCNEKYGKDYTESKWRKPYTIWRKTVDSVIYEDSTKIVEQELKRIARAKTRLDINRQVINQQRSLLNEEVRAASIVEMLNLALLRALDKDIAVDRVSPVESTNERNNYVFVRSDGHYDGNQDLGYEFGEIFNIIKERQKEYGFSEIVFAELGDSIEGASLRPSQLMAVKMGMVDQALDVARYYIAFLDKLNAELGIKVKFLIVESSNHTQLRQLGTGRSELPMDDLMVLISQMIKQGVKDIEGVEVISAPVIQENINGMSYIMEHGHDAPGIDKYMEKVESYYNKHFQYGYMGHFHKYNSQDVYEIDGAFTNKNITIVPHSCVNSDAFSDTRRLSSVPAIHFSIDTPKGKKHQENIVLEQSYKKAIERENTPQIVKIKDF